jgi:uncharacterized membrane protein required for colicin V production
MLIVCTLAIMLAVAYLHAREGLFTAVTMLVNVLAAGLVAFNFWEPLASLFGSGALKPYADILCLTFLFCITLVVLRTITNNLNDTQIEFPQVAQVLGGGAVGLLTGYLLSGFLTCALETLPWGQHFLDFEPRTESESGLRSIMPPDRVWLAMMHRASTHSFARGRSSPAPPGADPDYHSFDPTGAFETNYLRLRRVPDRTAPAEPPP